MSTTIIKEKSNAPTLTANVDFSAQVINKCKNKRISIIGAGGVASYAHIPNYNKLEVNVVALVDKNSNGIATAQAALKRQGNQKTFTSIDEFIESCSALQLDMIDIAVPSNVHEQVLRTLLESLKEDCPALLVQKPLAQSFEAATQIANLAEQYGVRILINLNGRFVPLFSKAREIVQSGQLGTIQFITILNRGLNKKSPDEWRGKLERLILYEMAVHHLDFLVWTLGAPSTVYASISCNTALGVQGETSATVVLKFDNGTIATVVEDWSCWTKEHWHYHPTSEEIVINGSLGSLAVTPNKLRLATEAHEQVWDTQSEWFPDAFGGVIAESISALVDERSSMLDAKEHLLALQLLETAYQSADENNVKQFGVAS